MRGVLFVVSLFFFVQVSISQSTDLLPVVQKGKWKLADTSGKVVLETSYDYISLFDLSGTAIVRKNNQYGVIDKRGKELYSLQPNPIKQLNFGMYAVSEKSGWSLFKTESAGEPVLTGLSELPLAISDNWIQFQRDSVTWLLNLPSAAIIPIPDSTNFDWVISEYLMLRKAGLYTFYGPRGELIVQDTLEINLGFNYAFVQSKKRQWFLTSAGEQQFPFKITGLHSNYDNTITLLSNKDAKVYSLPDYRLIFQGNYADIYPYDTDFYFVTNFNNTVNYVSRITGKKQFADKYQTLYQMGNYYYGEYLNGNLCLLEPNGTTVVQGAYTNLYTDDKFIYTHINTLKGLYSCKSKQELLQTIFTSIEIKELTIKATRSSAMVALKLDQNHRIIDRIYVENPYNLQTAPPPKQRRPELDPRLRALGWYIDSTERKDSDGYEFYTYLIGLRDQNDSILRKPSLKNLYYLSPDFALFKAKAKKVNYSDYHQTEIAYKQPYLNRNGKSFMGPILVDYDSTDFKTRSFMRISLDNTFGILTDTGSYFTYNYIQTQPGTYLVYCKDAEIKPTKESGEEFLEVPNMYLSNQKSDFQRPYLGYKAAKYKVHYSKAKWNYLKPTGEQLYAEDFDFAHPFVGSKAIVKRKGKWGVISVDSILIPLIYDQIQRIIKEKDTFFVCKNNTSGFIVLDSVLTAIDGTSNCFNSNGKIGVIEKKNKQLLVNNQFQELGDEQNYFKLHDNGFYTYKVKKDYFIVDESGNEIGQTKVKINRFIFNQYGVFEQGTRVGLVNLHGDTVLPAFYTGFEEIGTFILAFAPGNNVLLNADLTPIYSYTSGKVFIDPSTWNFAYTKDNNTFVFTPTGKKIGKWKSTNTHAFFNNKLIVLGKNGVLIDIASKKIDSLGHLTDANRFPNGYVAIQFDSKSHILYDANWKPLFGLDSTLRKINYLGEESFELRTKKGGTAIYNFKNQQRLTNIDDVEGTMETKRLLIRTGKLLYYVDDSLKRISNYVYSKAKPFVGNRAAVLDRDGWTVIDPSNNLLSYPDFNEITIYSEYFFKAKNKAHYGVYNNRGEVIVPCDYERVVFVNKKLVQTFLHGEIQYFRTSDGSIIR
jgi:hypothetical protein